MQFRVVVFLSLVVFSSLALSGAAIFEAARNGRHSRVELCRSVNQTRDAIAQVLELARTQTRADLIRRKAQADARFRAEHFYSAALTLVRPLDCASLTKGDRP